MEGFGFRVRVYGALTLEFKGLGFRVYRVYAFDVGFTTLGDDIVGGFFLLEVQEPRHQNPSEQEYAWNLVGFHKLRGTVFWDYKNKVSV